MDEVTRYNAAAAAMKKRKKLDHKTDVNSNQQPPKKKPKVVIEQQPESINSNQNVSNLDEEVKNQHNKTHNCKPKIFIEEGVNFYKLNYSNKRSIGPDDSPSTTLPASFSKNIHFINEKTSIPILY